MGNLFLIYLILMKLSQKTSQKKRKTQEGFTKTDSAYILQENQKKKQRIIFSQR